MKKIIILDFYRDAVFVLDYDTQKYKSVEEWFESSPFHEKYCEYMITDADTFKINFGVGAFS